MAPKQKPQSSKQDYSTPQDLIRAICNYLGISGFVFDFAADHSNTVAGPNFWCEADNSLLMPAEAWAEKCKGGWGWLNPPFKHIAPWAAKCHDAAQLGAKIAFLVPASVGSNWFLDYVYMEHFWLALNGRPHFMRDKPNWGYPKDCMIVFFGYHDHTENTEYDVIKWR